MFIDEESTKLELLSQNENIESSELCKLLIMGRREMLDAVSTFLHNNETTLRNIVVEHGAFTIDEVNKSLEDEYGA